MLRFFSGFVSLLLLGPGLRAADYAGTPGRFSATVVSNSLSHLHVRDFCQDSLGYMWIATARGLNRYNGYEYRQFFHSKRDTLTLDNDMIYSLCLDSQHRLWVGTSTGVNRYDFAGDRFIRYRADYGSVYDIFEDPAGDVWIATNSGVGRIDQERQRVVMNAPSQGVSASALLCDETGRLWAGTTEGLACFRPGDGRKRESVIVPIPGQRRANCICPDPQGIFMIGTSSGVVFFAPQTGRFLPLPALLASDKTLSSASIHFIREIAPLKYLIGTAANGLFLYDALRQQLRHNPSEYTEPMNSQELLSCSVDRQGNVWVGSFDKGAAVYSTQQDFFNCKPELSSVFRNIFTTRIIEDRYRNLWVGTRYKGLYHYDRSGRVRVYDTSNSRIFRDNSNLVEELFIDSRGQMWIACAEQIVVGTFTRSGDFSIRRIIPLSGTTGAATITEDDEGNIWFGLQSGLFRIRGGAPEGGLESICTANVPKIYRLASGKMLFSIYGSGLFEIGDDLSYAQLKMPTPKAAAIAGHCIDIFEDGEHRVWFGSYNEGAMCLAGDSCRTFSMADGLPCNDIICIKADRDGNLWMSTTNGLSRIGHNFSVTNYFDYDGTQGDLYNEKGGLLDADGTMYFTGYNGLTVFDPRLISRNSCPPRINIEDLKIHNESVRPDAGKGSILKNAVAFSEEVRLDHRHSVVTIDYAGIDFTTPRKLTYAYKLEGFDQHWNYVGDHRRATYSNLIPGEYTFRVKAFNSDGLESVAPATLRIGVKPAPWATWWASMLYAGAICAALLGFIQLWTKIKLQKHSLEIEANEREREREVTEMKMTFFTNISHELRTPLTLITAPVQQLSKIINPGSTEGKLLETISRNGQRLHRLMDQLLDFRKMEDGMLTLQTRPGELVGELDSIIDIYRSTASQKQVDVLFVHHTERLEMWYDADKIEKVMHNLLSNAMKYTPREGRITIATREISLIELQERYAEIQAPEERYAEISVADNGPGVPPDKLGELFVRYRQIASPTGPRLDYTGTGIGLHYTKRLIESHHGAIVAELPEGGGLKFSFVLPLGDVYAAIEKAVRPEASGADLPPEPEFLPEVPQSEDAGHKYTILVAEDNIELMGYFRLMLGEKYNLVCAPDGAEAWEALREKYADLVLSDVVMPGMTGYELCANIKQSPALSHIPVILLTAKTSMPEQIEGLSLGADAYICKPFNVEFLLLTIENQLKNREKLRIFYSTPRPATGEEEPPVALNTLDRTFMDNLMKLLEAEMSNPNLNIDDIAREMAFSRTSFYRKLKGLTDEAPADFLRNYRLKRAAEMIREGSWTLYEVAEMTGFGNYPHFSVLFKKHFNVTPKHYKGSEK
ncbi:MAG: response regulator [Alistipes sp.]|nr:response regulator [Alistipes sp.]